MAKKWVSVARLKLSAAVCAGFFAIGFEATALGQETTESASAESAATADQALTSEAPASPIPSGETSGVQAATSEPTSSNVPEAQPPAAAAPAPPQSGGFVQRLSDRLNGINSPPSNPVPAANRDPRADLLDTSFPAEQPEMVEPDPALGAPASSRRTQARTANGITELSNRPESPPAGQLPALNRMETPKSPLSRPQVNTEVNTPRLDSQVSLPTTSIPRTSSSMSPWLWVLAGTAALLLVPIAFLLTRPTR